MRQVPCAWQNEPYKTEQTRGRLYTNDSRLQFVKGPEEGVYGEIAYGGFVIRPDLTRSRRESQWIHEYDEKTNTLIFVVADEAGDGLALFRAQTLKNEIKTSRDFYDNGQFHECLAAAFTKTNLIVSEKRDVKVPLDSSAGSQEIIEFSTPLNTLVLLIRGDKAVVAGVASAAVHYSQGPGMMKMISAKHATAFKLGMAKPDLMEMAHYQELKISKGFLVLMSYPFWHAKGDFCFENHVDEGMVHRSLGKSESLATLSVTFAQDASLCTMDSGCYIIRLDLRGRKKGVTFQN